MTLDEFLSFIRKNDALDIARESISRSFIHAIPDEATYKAFIDVVREDYPNASQIAVMGSGNWKFSLNPKKNFSEYSETSDIDVAIVCATNFEKTWEEMRAYHREKFYLLSRQKRLEIRRSGENVYSGFVSPKWIPGKSSMRFSYSVNSNKYSTDVVGYRTVNMMYFKNLDEALDYYVRGFLFAQQGE